VTGGTPLYTYAWEDGATTEDRSNLAGGTYPVTVTDDNGCTAETSVVVNEAPAITVVETITDADCNGAATGSISLDISGGTPPYDVTWSPNVGSGENLGSLPLGTYVATITDAAGCTFEQEYFVGEAPALVIETPVVVDVSCNGAADGRIDLTVTGGTPPYTYAWEDGTTTEDRSSLVGGTYPVTVTDDNGCTAETTVTVEETPAITVIETVTDADCNGAATGSISLDISGGTPPYDVTWSPNVGSGDNLGSLPSGTYVTMITDSAGCTFGQEYFVGEAPAMVIETPVVVDVSCNGAADGRIDLTVTGGTPPYLYQWADGATTEDRENLTAGFYSVTITDANNCSVTLTDIEITAPSLLSATAEVSPPNCATTTDGNIDVTVMGGTLPYTFVWDTGETTEDLTGIGAGEYSLTITDAVGCTFSLARQVVAPADLALVLVPSDVACFGEASGGVALTVEGGTPPYDYAWNNGDETPNLTDVVAGTYSVVVTDANGCTQSGTAAIGEPDALLLTCTPANVSVTGGNDGTITLNWTGGTADFTVRLGDMDHGTTSNSPYEITGLLPGDYQVFLTDANGCSTNCTATINDVNCGDLTLGFNAEDPSCFGDATGSVTALPTGGEGLYTYLWDGGETTATLENIIAGTYAVTVTDSRDCTVSGSVSLTTPPALTGILNPTPLICNGDESGSIDLAPGGGVPPYTFAWSNDATTEDLSGIPAGEYTVVITDDNSCTLTLTTTVTEPGALNAGAMIVPAGCGPDGEI
ncbi:MAG: SprB repeat-containing protein, partial [Bacteroidota bacterium]